MKTEIKEDDRKIVISTDELDNDNFVDLSIYVDEGDMIEATIPVEELYTAAKAFYEMRGRRQRHDNLLK